MKTIAVLFGGQSSEHEVSCHSVMNVAGAIDTDRYEIVLIGITKEGRWLYVPSIDMVGDDSWREKGTPAILSPDATQKCIVVFGAGNPECGECAADANATGDKVSGVRKIPVDVAFPVLHGLYGEDGTIQGLFTLAKIPYVGCGVLSSAISMDKFFTKLVVDTTGARQAKYVPVFKRELTDMDAVIAKIEKSLDYPVFVKPSNAGSSCGVSKAADREALRKALSFAAEYDYKILVEETIVGRELECAVFADSSEPVASCPGEILAADEFYSYDAKYNNAESKTVVDPKLPEGKKEEIRKLAVKIFRAVDGFGLARVDFFMEEKTGDIVFNEINTLPGFTAISMYPMLFEASGMPKKELVEKLIQSAYKRER
ncbi:MAG: D-alanine--D-alanine ligase [Lachnospiraceae bacterium]|nr:D-alanine--D-alanine ligase [Lachnospiraceae bacterium]